MSHAVVRHNLSIGICLLFFCCQAHQVDSDITTEATQLTNNFRNAGVDSNANTNQAVMQRNIDLSVSANCSVVILNITTETRIVLSCNLSAENLDRTLTWEKDGNITDNKDESQQFQFRSNSDAGNYTCIYSNSSTSLIGIFVVQILPILAMDEKVTRSNGDSANLTCKSEFAPLNWTWLMEVNGSKTDLSNNIHHYNIKSDGKVSSLLIENLVADKGTYYYCRAVYEVGTASQKILLRVHNFIDAIIPFVFIVGEVLISVSIILFCEWKMKTKGDFAVNGTEIEKFHEKVSAEEPQDNGENGTQERSAEEPQDNGENGTQERKSETQ